MEHKNGAAAPLEENRSPTSRELDERNALLAQELDRAYLHNGRRLDQAVFHSRAEDEDVEAMLHKWLAKQEEEERAGGHSRLTLLLRRLMFWVAVLLLPNLVTLALASTPLGDPADIFSRHGSWPTLMFVNPIIMTVIGYLSVTAYFGCVESPHPFKAFLPMIFVTYFMEILVLVPLVWLFGYFEFIGLISFGIAYITAFIAAYVLERFDQSRAEEWQRLFWQYIKIAVANFVHLAALCVYVIFFREVPANIQPVLSFGLSIFTFINRKTILSFSDPFPIELGMLISGFWVNNMTDMFQTLAYPNVKNPMTFLYIWALQFCGDVANLIFLTHPWFVFRIWIKGILTGKWGANKNVENNDDLPDDRGHSNNRPGYLRRQARFYFWRIVSKLAAIVFYLFISTVLRYGPNSQYYNFSEDPYISLTDESGRELSRLSDKDYLHSVIYVSCNAVFVTLAGLAGYFLLRFRYTDVYVHLAPVAKVLRKNKAFIGYAVAIVAHNGLLALAFIQYHQRIWWYDSLEP